MEIACRIAIVPIPGGCAMVAYDNLDMRGANGPVAGRAKRQVHAHGLEVVRGTERDLARRQLRLQRSLRPKGNKQFRKPASRDDH
jgi:hypothetical protein